MAVTTLACPNSSCTVTPAFPQVSQKGFNILSGSVFQRFFRQKIGKVFCPIHVEPHGQSPWYLHEIPSYAKVSEDYPPVAKSAVASILQHRNEWSRLMHSSPGKTRSLLRRRIKCRTIRPYPVLFRARPVGFPKKRALFGIAGVHDFHPENPFYFKRLSKNQALHAMQNYNIIILFSFLISIRHRKITWTGSKPNDYIIHGTEDN
jgi:hypothetical protein